MSSFDPADAAEDLHEQLGDEADVTTDELEDMFADYANLDVPKEEAMHSITNRLENVEDVDATDNTSTELKLDEIEQDDQSVDVEGEVVTVYDDTHDAIKQKGRIGDDTGTVGFVEFKGDSDHPTLEEGKSYRFENAVTDEYRGNYSVKLLQNTEVEELDRDIEVDDGNETITAPIVNVLDGSGLIERCPDDDCTYVIDDRACPDHGHTDGEDDLRIMAHIDTGHEVQRVIIGTDLTEEIMGFTVDDAVDKAHDAMDKEVVTDEIREELVGRYFRFTGLNLDSFIVEEYEEVDNDPAEAAEGLLQRADDIEL